MRIYSYLVWLLLSVGLLFPSFAQDTKDKDRTMAEDTTTQQTPSQDKPIPLSSTQSESDFLKTPAVVYRPSALGYSSDLLDEHGNGILCSREL